MKMKLVETLILAVIAILWVGCASSPVEPETRASGIDGAALGSAAIGGAGGGFIGNEINSDYGAPVGAAVGATAGLIGNKIVANNNAKERAEAKAAGIREGKQMVLDRLWQEQAIEGEGQTGSRILYPSGINEGVAFGIRDGTDYADIEEPVR